LRFRQLIDTYPSKQSWRDLASLDPLLRKGKPVSLALSEPIAAYFAADKNDGESVARYFTEQAVVTDEGHTHIGRAAIVAWKTAASAKYHYTSEPIAVADQDGKTVVTAHLVGDFPGSPVDLSYLFALDGDKIASLEIIP
jgi:SnoaL-like domain